MKIFLVGRQEHDGIDILGIYSTREKALEALSYLNAHVDDIQEYEVDLPNNGNLGERSI